MKNAFLKSLCLSVVLFTFFMAGCSKKPEILVANMKTNHGTMIIELFEDKTPLTVENFVGLAEGTKTWTAIDGTKKNEPFYDGLTFHRVIKDFMIQGGCPQGTGTGGPGYQFQDECYAGTMIPLNGEIADEETAGEVFSQLLLPHLREHQGNSPIPVVADLFKSMQTQRSYQAMIGMTVEQIQEMVGSTEPLSRFEQEIDPETKKPTLLGSVDYGTLCMANSGPSTNGSQFFIVTKKEGADWLNGKHTVFGKVLEGMEIALAIQDVEKGPSDKPLEPVTIESITIERITKPKASS